MKNIFCVTTGLLVIVLAVLSLLSRFVPAEIGKDENGVPYGVPHLTILSDCTREYVIVEFQLSSGPFGHSEFYDADYSAMNNKHDNKIILRKYVALIHPFSKRILSNRQIVLRDFIHNVDGKREVYYGDTRIGYLETSGKKVRWFPEVPSHR